MTSATGGRASGLSPAARHHIDRRRELVAAHPGLAALRGPNRATVLAFPVLLALHWGTTWLVHDQGLLVVFLTAFFWGQFVLHSGGALVHEAAHALILPGPRGRLFVDALLETLLTSFGHQAQYQLDHVRSHHPYLGDYERDYEHKDVCRFSARLDLRRRRPGVHRALLALHLLLDLLPLGFVVSDDLVAALERRSTSRVTDDPNRCVPSPRVRPRRRAICVVVSSLTLLGVGLAFGPYGVLYWIWALSIFQGRWGLTNVGQVLSEHPTGDETSPTRSDYGPWNLVLFNTGYHDEHHTFPFVTWNRLPRVRAAAPGAFTPAERGYLGWWFGYVFRGEPRRPSRWVGDAERRCAGTRDAAQGVGAA